MVKERYGNLDGIRAYACIGIVLMHVLANGNYSLTGFAFERFIPSLTNFTLLFMRCQRFQCAVDIMSGFRMEQSASSSSIRDAISGYGRFLFS